MSAERMPTIERPSPICNDVFCALDDIGCSAERLRTLFSNNTQSLNEAIERIAGTGAADRDLTDIWMIFILAVEKFTELEADIGATQDAFLAVRAGRAPPANRKAVGIADAKEA
ncbi:hypothetical protein [Sphingomonas sp. UYP23]